MNQLYLLLPKGYQSSLFKKEIIDLLNPNTTKNHTSCKYQVLWISRNPEIYCKPICLSMYHGLKTFTFLSQSLKVSVQTQLNCFLISSSPEDILLIFLLAFQRGSTIKAPGLKSLGFNAVKLRCHFWNFFNRKTLKVSMVLGPE